MSAHDWTIKRNPEGSGYLAIHHPPDAPVTVHKAVDYADAANRIRLDAPPQMVSPTRPKTPSDELSWPDPPPSLSDLINEPKASDLPPEHPRPAPPPPPKPAPDSYSIGINSNGYDLGELSKAELVAALQHSGRIKVLTDAERNLARCALRSSATKIKVERVIAHPIHRLDLERERLRRRRAGV